MNMTTKLKNIRRIFTASALLMLLGLVSCTSEAVTGHSSDSTKGEARQVRFALNMGGQGTTRATATDATAVTAQKRENTITKLYAVVFTPDAANQLTAGSFSKTYEVTLTDMATLNADPDNTNQIYNEGTFTVDEAGLYYMFLVANPGEALEKNLTNADGATNALTTAKAVSDFYNLVESDQNPVGNAATGFLMTSKMIQLDIKGDAETDLRGTEISLTRAAARFDIDASALGSDFVLTSVKFNNRHPKTVLVNTGTNEDATVGESSSSATAPTYNKPASLPAATATMPADPSEYLSAYVWKGGIYGYENHVNAQANVDGGSEANAGDGITQLIVSGTYKGIAVSQTVDFWSKEKVAGSDPVEYTYTTIPVNRNTIYTVKLLPKATPDQYAPFAYTIGVADWKEGETIVYKGSDLAQPYTPELVSITREVWDETNNEWTSEKSLNLSTISLNVTDNGEARTVDAKKTFIGRKTCRLAIKVKTGTSGCNILCPELSEELAGATSSYLDTNPAVTSKKGDVKGFFETEQSSPECEYDDADGTMYQTWYVQISGDNAFNQEFNFTLTNQLNSQNAYIAHFQLRVLDPKLNPLWWCGEYNLNQSMNAFDKRTNVSQGYLHSWSLIMSSNFAFQASSYNDWKTFAESTNALRTIEGVVWHMPTLEEFRSIFPMKSLRVGLYSTTEYPAANLTAPSTSDIITEQSCVFGYDATTQLGLTGKSYWGPTSTTVRYAIRFIGTNYCSAWRYEYLDWNTTNARIVVSSRLIDRIELEDAETLASEMKKMSSTEVVEYWSDANLTDNVGGVKRVFYACGYGSTSGMAAPGTDSNMRCCYWTATAVNASTAYHLEIDQSAYSIYWDTYGVNGGFSVRLFRDE